MPATALMTVEEFLALPDTDDVERWLINGELRERPITRRNRFHCYSMTRLAKFLDNWLDTQPEPRGQILTGDAGVQLKDADATLFGVDVAYVSADLLAAQTEDSTIVQGVPILAAEILSPNDTIEEVNEKIDVYLQAGVPIVWVLDPHRMRVEPGVPLREQEIVRGRVQREQLAERRSDDRAARRGARHRHRHRPAGPGAHL